MAQSSRTFRIFVSSTFSDLKAERNALQEKVFPRLRDLATAHSCRFQAIDLRWGVSEEAALDQQTMKICLGEIERCQKTSPRPNFIVLLGNRYGWRPLPYEIPADEFKRIISLVPAEERSLVEEWYRRDDNAVPPVYCLQPRSGEFEEYSAWENVELRLHTVLADASQQAGFSANQLLKYTASATEQEIVAGALKVPDAGEHVFCFLRDITGLPDDDSAASFREIDPEAAQQQTELKERLRQSLAGNVHEYTSRWQSDGLSLEHLDQLCEDVYAELSKVILAEVGLLETVEPLEREIAAHAAFGSERARVFIGRVDILKAVFDYVAGSDPHPLAIWGVSGSGKSALMAKEVEQTRLNGKDVIYRFIGATPGSSNGRALLESLCRQISRRYGADETNIPAEYKDLVQEFPKRLALAKPDKPLIIFLDALDQLSDTDNARNLAWLPADLPPNVRLIVSTLPGECLKALAGKLPEQNRQEVQPMSVEDGKAILSAWFEGVHRKLQDDQEQYLLNQFRDCGLPLYLKLAFEEARQWKSYDSILELSEDIPGILQDLFKRLSQESNHGNMLVSRSLGYLVAARNGLSEDELLDVLWADPAVQADFFRRSPKSPQEITALPVVIWSRLYFDLEPYLAERSADGASLLTFYHRQLAEACQAAYHDKARHAGLAEYFNPQPLYLGKDEQAPNLRKLSEMVYQQAWAGLSTQVKKVLLDYTYLQAKLVGQGVQELIDDYALVPKAGVNKEKEKSLSLLQGALRLSAHVLSKDPLQLPGQLTGRLLGIEESELKGLLEQIRLEVKHPWLRPLHVCLEVPGGPLLRTLAGHTDQVRALALTPDGRRAVSGSLDHTLRLWDLETGECILTLEHSEKIYDLAMTQDGQRVISCSGDRLLTVWDMTNGKCLRTYAAPDNAHGEAVAVSPDGKKAYSRYYLNDRSKGETILKVWDLENGECLRTLDLPPSIQALQVTPDGRQVIIGEIDGTLGIWDLESGDCLRSLKGHKSIIQAIALTPDGQRVVSGSWDKTLKVWALKTGQCTLTLQVEGNMSSNFVGAVAVTPDGRRAVSSPMHNFVSESNRVELNRIRVWDLETGKCLYTLSGHTDEVTAVVLTSDGQRLVSGSEDNTIKVWDLDNSESSGRSMLTDDQQTTYKHNQNRILNDLAGDKYLQWVARSILSWDARRMPEWPDGRQALRLSDNFSKTHQVIDLETGATSRTLKWDAAETGQIVRVVLTLDGRRAVSISRNHAIRVWNMQSGGCLFTLQVDPNYDYVVAPGPAPLYGYDIVLTPDQRQILTGANDGAVKVWDLENGEPVRTLGRGWLRPTALALSPDGRSVVIGYRDGSLSVWDFESGAFIRSLEGHEKGVVFIALSPDGRWGASMSLFDNTYKEWDLQSGVCLRTLKEKEIPVDMRMLQNGQHAVSELQDQTLKVWDLESGRSLGSFRGNGPLQCVKVSPDGLTFAAQDANGRIHFLHLENVDPTAPISTAWDSDGALAFACPHCRTWSEIQKSALGTEIPCPNCGKSVRLNPFTIQGDWKPIAEAWQKNENKR